MKKFRFKLATVLEVRKSREQEALVALAAAQREYQAAQAHKLDLQRQLQESLLRREKLGHESTGIVVFHTEQDFINGTKAWLIRADQAIVRANRGVEKALRSYLHVRKQSRMIETLEETARREHRLETAKKEQRQMDDLNVMRSRLKEESA
jgi:flagellar FliJ protein